MPTSRHHTSQDEFALSCGNVPHPGSMVTRHSDSPGPTGGEIGSIDASAVHPGCIPVTPALQHADALHAAHVPHSYCAVKENYDCKSAVCTGCKGLDAIPSMVCIRAHRLIRLLSSRQGFHAETSTTVCSACSTQTLYKDESHQNKQTTQGFRCLTEFLKKTFLLLLQRKILKDGTSTPANTR